MAYIYKIVNDINKKIYVGATSSSLEKRFKEHCQAAKIKSHRPLYMAMQKYGIDHFHIELIEETDMPQEREVYWIEHYGSFKHGYNATLGGNGKHYCDYDLICAFFREGKTIKEIATILNCDGATCRTALENNGINAQMRKQRQIEVCAKSILQLNANTDEIIQIYPSITAAYRKLNKPHSGHIAEACNGKRKTAYGFKWQYGEKVKEEISF